jgi:hypothetical protein
MNKIGTAGGEITSNSGPAKLPAPQKKQTSGEEIQATPPGVTAAGPDLLRINPNL